MNELDLREVFKAVQTIAWLSSFLITISLVASSHWKDSRMFLRINASLWAAATSAMFFMSATLKVEQLFPWGFKWWCGLAPVILCFAGTSILWACHSAMSELNKKNNRRSSILVASPGKTSIKTEVLARSND